MKSIDTGKINNCCYTKISRQSIYVRGTLKVVSLFLLISVNINLFGQETVASRLEKGLVFNFSDDGKYFVKLGSSFDFWTRGIQYNPGTKDPSGEEIKTDFDFVLRRAVVTTTVKLDRFTAFAGIGTGTQTFMVSASPYTTSKPVLYYYDFFGSYELIREKLKIGYGLNLYKGLSRYSSCSAGKTLGADVPMLAAPDVLTTDQMARKLGFFVAGNVNKINYRVSIGKPFVVNTATRPSYGLYKAADAPNNHVSFEGYAAFQFLDKEVSFLPFYSATYIGKKKVFNIGAGFYSQQNSTLSINAANDTVTHDKFHFAIDMFLEYPFTNGSALTAYGAFFSYNYGPNYLLNGGAGNILVTTADPSTGISEPNFGTGNAVATQLAWLFPKVYGQAGKIQAYYEGNYMFFDALNTPALHHNIGVNYFVFNHNLKFTAQYELRPYIFNSGFDSYKSLFIFKTQVSF